MDMGTLIATTDAIFADFNWLDDLADCLGSFEDEQRRIFKLLLLCLLRRHRDNIQTTGEAMLRLQERTLTRAHRDGWSFVLDQEGCFYPTVLRLRRDSDFLLSFKLTVEAFDKLHAMFGSLWDPFVRTPGAVGRPRRLNTERTLALVLVFLTSHTSITVLVQLFGCPLSTLSTSLHQALPVVSNACARLGGEPEWPSEATMANLSSRLSQHSDIFTCTWGNLDGHMLRVQRSSEPSVQGSNYSGWLHSNMISNLYVWSFDGLIRWAGVNFPGTTHDAWIAQGIVDKIRAMPGDYNILGDSAFPSLGGKIEASTTCALNLMKLMML